MVVSISQTNTLAQQQVGLRPILKTYSSSKFYSQQNTTMEQYQEKENTL